MGEILRRKHYVNVKAYVTSNFPKKVRYKGLPPSLERHENLAKDLRYLHKCKFETLQPHRSLVLYEKFGCEEPISSLEYSTNFWEQVFSDDWRGATLLRVCEGQLLDLILEGLFIATDRGVLQTYQIARFDEIPRPLKSSLKHSRVEGDILSVPVKITFTYYSKNESPPEHDRHHSLKIRQNCFPINGRQQQQKSSHKYSLSSNLQTMCMRVLGDEDAILPYEETELNTAQISTINTGKNSSLKELRIGHRRWHNVHSQRNVRLSSSIAETMSHIGSHSSQYVTKGDQSSTNNLNSLSQLKRSIISSNASLIGNRMLNMKTSSGRFIQQFNRNTDLGHSRSGSESDLTSQSSRTPTPESILSSVHFESVADSNSPTDDSSVVSSVQSLSLLNDKNQNSQDCQSVEMKQESATSTVVQKPLLVDVPEQTVNAEDENDASELGHKTGDLVTKTNDLKVGHQLNKYQLLRRKAIKNQPKTDKIVNDSKQLDHERLLVPKLLFVKYGDSLTKTPVYSQKQAAEPTRKNSSEFKQLPPLVKYDRRAVRNSEYFKRAANAKIHNVLTCEECPINPAIPSTATTTSPIQEKTTLNNDDEVFQTNRLVITHSLTRMRRIERKKEIIKSIKPLPKKWQRVAEKLEAFIKKTHLPRQQLRMWQNRALCVSNMPTKQALQTDEYKTDTWISQAKEIFQNKIPNDFYAKLVEASSKFLICKEQLTWSNTWNTITTVTFKKKY